MIHPDINHAEMLKQLQSSIKELHKARKIMDKIVDENIAKLPEDKRKQATDLLNKARKGKHINMSEMMAFTSGIRDIDKDEIKKSVKRANDKKTQVSGK